MKLTPEQAAVLSGSKGETMAKVMETLVRYGELFGADEMVPVTSTYNHLVTSFGLKALAPVYELMGRGRCPARRFRWTPSRWTSMCHPTFCKIWCSTNLCTPSRIFMRVSSNSWGC